MGEFFDDEERLEFVKEFLTESRELLDEVEPQIIAMEQTAASSGKVDEEILNSIFRLFHSLKGASSFLDFQTISRVTHEAETLLDIFRKQKARVEPGHVDLLCRTSDFIRALLDRVEQQLTDRGFEATAEAIIADLREAIRALSGEQVPRRGAEADGVAVPPGEVPDRGAADGEAPEDAGAGTEELSLELPPEMIKRFTEETAALCDEAEAALLALEKAPDDPEYAGQAFRALHSLKGNAGFFGYAEIEELSHYAEAVLDLIREGQKECDSVTISFLLIAVDALRERIRQVSNGLVPEIPGKKELLEHLARLAGSAAGGPAEAGAEPVTVGESEPGPAGEGAVQSTAGRADARGESEAEAGEPGGSADTRERQLFAGQQQVIRVDVEKLDKLLDLVGELVIAEAMVANIQISSNGQAERFEKAILRLDKITREIQEVAMAMRMIPLAGTFRKMVRLVRDLSHKANKKVDLQIIGEETEVDKTIIEQISDPLVHLIRNAVDHGIESPEERRAAGKLETGRIVIEAKHSVGEVWIIVADDGRGLDREKILRKGVEKGLITGEERELKDEEVWRLIFEPGFSTAEKVSSVSGRGVGMDVVKRNIERIRGKIDVRSRPGGGTMFIIRIPLTLAIIEGMVVQVGSNRYTIPIGSIKESFQPRMDQITRTPDNLEVVRIRGELLPVIRLHELYRVRPNYEQLTEGILIVVENSEQKYCLFVDELVGQQQIVIKGLSSYLGHVRGVSGCAILGDGDISMILDIADLFSAAESLLGQLH
jgi:two-component system chemotaxis sensor kinase CheA